MDSGPAHPCYPAKLQALVRLPSPGPGQPRLAGLQYNVCIYLFTEVYFKELAHIITVDGKVKICWLDQQAEI